jgi:hypothetical protein
MTTIGNSALAKDLFISVMGPNHYGDGKPDAPWTYLGSGCYRTAYLHKPTNVVYKIGDSWTNKAEALNARNLRRKSTRSLPFDLYIPHTRTYTFKSMSRHGDPAVIISQEFAAKAKYTACKMDETWRDDRKCTCKQALCYYDVQCAVAEWSGLEDLHSENLLVDNKGRFWVIDLGC